MNKETEYSPKEIIRDLISIQKFLPEFLNLNKDYKDIIELLLQFDLDDFDTPYPSVKSMQDKLGMNYGEVKRKLHLLWEDVKNYEKFGINFSINQVEYVFFLKYFEKNVSLTFTDLPIVPRVGEKVQIPFFRAIVGKEYFYVTRIEHYIDNTKQTIQFTLASGDYNLFWHLKKDEEYVKGNISLEEYYSSSKDLILKERFGLR